MKNMKIIIPVFILISALMQGCSQNVDSTSAIIGRWELVSLSIHGKSWIQKEEKQSVTTFTGDAQFQIQVGITLAAQGTYSFDDPNLDMVYSSTNDIPRTTVKYILTISNDTLTLCNLENGIRPESFNETTNSIVQVLQKIK